MGPETEARDCVSPFDTDENKRHRTIQIRTYRSQTVPIRRPCRASRRQYAAVLYRHFLAHQLGKKASRQKAQSRVEFNHQKMTRCDPHHVTCDIVTRGTTRCNRVFNGWTTVGSTRCPSPHLPCNPVLTLFRP
jgi:hypothetical protein